MEYKFFNFGKLFLSFLSVSVCSLCIGPVERLRCEIKDFAAPKGKSLFLFKGERKSSVWNSSNESVAKVDNGVVLLLEEGETEIFAVPSSIVAGCDSGGVKYAVHVNPPELLKSVAYVSEHSSVIFFAITNCCVKKLKVVLKINNNVVESIEKDITCISDGENFCWEIPINLSGMACGNFKANVFAFNGTDWCNERNGEICGYFPGTEEGCYSKSSKRAVSRRLINFIMEWEGFVPRLVVDCLVPGVYNIGYGDVINFGETFYNNITKRQAFVDFVNKLNFGKYVEDVNKFVIENNIRCTQNQFDALVSFSYNFGTAWLKNSRLKDVLLSAKKLGTGCVDFSYFDPKLYPENVELYHKLVKEFLLYHHVLNSRRCIPGLLYRRISELDMFLFGEYSKENGKLNLHDYKIPDCISLVH